MSDLKETPKSRVEDDAAGQFVSSKKGRKNNGVASATPRVTTGTDDATLGTDHMINQKSRATKRPAPGR